MSNFSLILLWFSALSGVFVNKKKNEDEINKPIVNSQDIEK